MWAGCASVGVQTAGETPQMRWQATDLNYYTVAIEEREVYKYTLVLEDLQGRDVTFTYLKAKLQNNATSPPFDWEKTGTWTLSAHGELRITLGSYRYCHQVDCIDWGPLAPVWNLTLSGTDSHGQPVQEVIRFRLPYIDETA
jgi:hypothetical protein